MIKIIYGVLLVMVTLSLLETFFEYDNYKKQYLTSKRDLLDGSYHAKYKTIEDVLENRINSYEFIYVSYKQKLYWDSGIVILVLIILFIKKRNRKNLKTQI